APDVRTAAEQAVVDRWDAVLALAQETRDLQLDHRLQERLRQVEKLTSGQRPTAEPDDAQAARRANEGRLIGRRRRETEERRTLMLDAAGAIEGGAESLRMAIWRRQFPMCTNKVFEHRSILRRLHEMPDFDGRDSLEAGLEPIGRRLESLAEQAVQTCLPAM